MMQIYYLWPIAGSPPTAAQASKVSVVNVGLNPTNSADNSQIITHNFGLTTQQISQGWPHVYFDFRDSLGPASLWYVQSVNPNFVVVGRNATTAGVDTTNNQQVVVAIDRIWSGSK
jgi:hypothetical protein